MYKDDWVKSFVNSNRLGLEATGGGINYVCKKFHINGHRLKRVDSPYYFIFRLQYYVSLPAVAAVTVTTPQPSGLWRSATAATPWTSSTTSSGTWRCSNTSCRCTPSVENCRESVVPSTSSLGLRSTSTTTRRSCERRGRLEEAPFWDTCAQFSCDDVSKICPLLLIKKA